MNPRESLRKILGLYEHELNGWLEQALNRVSRVVDVGANDGYFTFGCAAAFRRLGVVGEITGFEPQTQHVRWLRESITAQEPMDVRINIVQAFVGRTVSEGMTTLDALPIHYRCNTLVKVDVEGSEVDVVAGATTWMDSSNLYLIEVHKVDYLAQIIDMFEAHGHELEQVDQRPLPFLGREERDLANWWLVSRLAVS